MDLGWLELALIYVGRVLVYIGISHISLFYKNCH